MRLFVYAALAVAIGSSVVLAQSDVIKERQQIMKGVGGATRDAAAMLKGEAPFNLATAQKSLAVYADSARRMPALFPANSQSGGDTTAAPKIWQDMAGFNAAFQRFGADADAALVSIKDETSFKAGFPAVLKNCGTCHEDFRLKKG